jgi:hypothetical protein
MTRPRSFFLAAACTLPFSLIACGSDDKGTAPPDTSMLPPEGTHYQYVVSKLEVPVTTKQQTDFGLDLGGTRSSTPDGTIDNGLETLLQVLVGVGKFPLQDTVNDSVNQGAILLLADLQTTSFMNAAAAGLSVKFGADPQPPACTDATDTACGHHLQGNGSFSIAASSPTSSTVSGAIAGGTLTAGPGNLSIQIALGTTAPITLNLVNARVKATEISETGMTAVIGGELLETELQANVFPAVTTQIAAVVARDCTTTTVPDCGCTGTGAQLIGLLDLNPKDCVIGLDEVAKGPFAGLLLPDVCSKASCGANMTDALSLGVKVTAVKATFPQ